LENSDVHSREQKEKTHHAAVTLVFSEKKTRDEKNKSEAGIYEEGFIRDKNLK